MGSISSDSLGAASWRATNRDGRRNMRVGRVEIAPLVVVLLGLALAAMGFASSASAAAPCTTPPAGGGDWPSYGHDSANTRTQPAESGLGPTAVTQLAPAWTFSTTSTGDETGFNSTPV